MTTPAEVTYSYRIDWPELLALDYQRVGWRLVSIGVPDDDVRRFEEAARSAVASVPAVDPSKIPYYEGPLVDRVTRRRDAERITKEDRANALKQTFWDFLKGRELIVEEETTKRLLCPLFTIAGPPTAGSRVTWASASMEEGGSNWRLTGFGTGLGQDTSVSLRRSVEVRCDSGQVKQVSVIVPVQVRRVVTVLRGVRQGEGLSAEVAPLERGEQLPFDVRTQGIEVATPERVLAREDYDLTHDDSNSASVFTVEVQMARESSVELGIKAFGLEAVAEAKVRREQEATLEIELVPGRRYSMLWVTNPSGVAWSNA